MPFFMIILLILSICAAGGQAGQMPPERSVAVRIGGRTFPSVFQAWNPADNLQGEDRAVTLARHDLVFQDASFFGLQWDNAAVGLATDFTAKSLARGRARRAALLARNPNQILLMEIRYRDAAPGYLPADSPWWKRDQQGHIVAGWAEGGYTQLDFANPAFRARVATQCAAAVRSGVVDGVMLDWWQDDDDRLALIQAIRRQIGEQALILANANDRVTPRTAPYLNGYFMECYRSETAEDWQRIAATLTWAERQLRAPHINCVETWYHHSRADLDLMRATTTLALTLSDGYCLFSDPNPLPTPDHLHDWYPFWNTKIGHPLAAGYPRPDGGFQREFTGGTAVYNPLGNPPITLAFDAPRTSAATGRRARNHTLNGGDGDCYLP